MKKLLMGLMLSAFGLTSANAYVINGVNIENGIVLDTGVLYMDATDMSNIVGIGSVDVIRDADSNIIWSTGVNGVELNFVYYSYERIFSQITLANEVYGSQGGVVQFYTNALGTFTATGDYTSDAAAITGGDLWLDTIGAENSGGFTVVGSATLNQTANTGNGWLNVIGGAAADAFDTNSIFVDDESPFADMTYNFSVDNINTAGYWFSGSVDATLLAQVDSPSPLLLMAGGLLGILGVTRKTKG